MNSKNLFNYFVLNGIKRKISSISRRKIEGKKTFQQHHMWYSKGVFRKPTFFI